MRILHIGKYAPPARGGIETFVRDLSAEQIRLGHSVSVLCHQAEPGRCLEIDLIDEVRFIRSPVLCNTAISPVAPTFFLHLKRVVASLRPDIIHLHLPNPAALFHGCLPKDTPLVIHWHADVQNASHKMVNALYPIYRPFEEDCLEKASRIIATSAPYLASSPTLARWQPKCEVVPLGLAQDRYPLLPDSGKPERPLVLGVGRFSYYKGFKHLVQAAALVPAAEFVILGDGPKLSSIRREIDRLGLAGRVHLPGAASDETLRRHLQQASLFCLPSVNRGEAFGLVLLEAMRYGLPLVSTAIPGSGTGWVNQGNVTGKVVPPADTEALAQAINEIISDPSLAGEYGKAARKRFEENFTITQTAKSMDFIYAEVINGR